MEGYIALEGVDMVLEGGDKVLEGVDMVLGEDYKALVVRLAAMFQIM